MPTLNWIGKAAVVKHHKDVPYRLLEPVGDLSCRSATDQGSDSGNLIVHGDNLRALLGFAQSGGKFALKRHFFPVIGNLKSKGEEFDCAEFIANRLEGVAWWVRNVDRKPSSFSLRTSSDRFYPDFLIGLENSGIVAVEYKGSHIAESRDSVEKKQIGELWEKRSKGCAFAWVENRNWSAIRTAIARCLGD